MNKLKFDIGTSLFGNSIYSYEEIGSTNTRALEMAAEGIEEGAVILAEYQSAGRGQNDHKWHSPAGLGLYFSVILKPDLKISSMAPLTICAGLAAAKALKDICALDILLKWPNDLYYKNKKLGGILLEAASQNERLKHLVLGIGININHNLEQFPKELRNTSTSLFIERGEFFEKLNALKIILNELEENYFTFLEQGFEPFICRFDEIDFLKGREISVKTAAGILEGRDCGIDQNGALLLKTKKGVEAVLSGRVIF